MSKLRGIYVTRYIVCNFFQIRYPIRLAVPLAPNPSLSYPKESFQPDSIKSNLIGCLEIPQGTRLIILQNCPLDVSSVSFLVRLHELYMVNTL